jgi:hypothetical protein
VIALLTLIHKLARPFSPFHRGTTIPKNTMMVQILYLWNFNDSKHDDDDDDEKLLRF